MNTLSNLIVEMYEEVMYQIENNLFEERLSSKESFRRAIALWKNLPEGKKESEAKRILKASKREGYTVKQKDILAYADKIEDYGKMKAKKAVRKEIRSKKKAKREEKFFKVLTNVKDEDLENKTRIELLALAIKRGGSVKELTKLNREELLNLFPETAKKKKEDKNKGDDVDFNFVTKKDKSKIKEQDYDKTFTRIRKEDIEKFKTAIDFASKDELRPVLTGVYIGEGKVVATDSLKMVFDDIGLKLDEPVILNSADLKLALKNVKDTKDIEVKKIVKENKAPKPTETFYQMNGVNVRVIDGKYPLWERIIPTRFEDTGKVTKSEIDNVIKKAEDQIFKIIKNKFNTIKEKQEQIKEIESLLGLMKMGGGTNKLSKTQKTKLESLSAKDFEKEIDKMIKYRITKNIKEFSHVVFDGEEMKIVSKVFDAWDITNNLEVKAPGRVKIKYLKNDSRKLAFRTGKLKEVIDSLGEENLDLSILSPSHPVVINKKAILMPLKVD